MAEYIISILVFLNFKIVFYHTNIKNGKSSAVYIGHRDQHNDVSDRIWSEGGSKAGTSHLHYRKLRERI